jgi:hypothetical protein
MQLTACSSFSIATSTEGMPIAATEIDIFVGQVRNLLAALPDRCKCLCNRTESLQHSGRVASAMKGHLVPAYCRKRRQPCCAVTQKLTLACERA